MKKCPTSYVAYDFNNEIHGTFPTKKEAFAFALERNREHGDKLNIHNKLWVREHYEQGAK
jgi:hypothetical protein